MLDSRSVSVHVVLALAVILAAVPVSAASAAAKQPSLRVHPRSAMVNTDVMVKGSGFAANADVTLAECGATFWIAPAEPCNTENEMTVQTNAKGRFSTSFEVQLCPEPGAPASDPTKRVCYIGVPAFGEDTGMLEPAAKVKVTYP
jgi:Neocarzinostatin family